MKQFTAVFLGSEKAMTEWGGLSEPARKEREQKGMAAWGAWVENNKKNIVVMGSPLGKTLKIGKGGVSPTKNNLTAFTVVQAESHEAAAKMFLEHPHFSIFPGDSIEVMENLPIPGQ